MKRRLLVAVVCFLALVLVSCACRRKETKAGGVAALGERAPDFTLNDLKTKTVSLSSFKGKVILLDFWATWCYPCRIEIPHFKELHKKYNASGLEVVGIALDRGGADVVKPFAEKEGINYTLLIADTTVVKDYGGISAIPTTFIIDRKGDIQRKYVGVPKNISVFEHDVKELLGK